MKATTPECAALLQSARQIFMVELVTVTLADGSVIRWACSDVDIVFGALTWSRGPLIERESVTLSVGIEVTSCSMTFRADDSVTVRGVPLLQAARRGVLGGAEILVQKGFTDDPANPLLGLVHVFEGRIGDVEIDSTSVKCDVRSFAELLDTMVPRNVYQASCLHTLYSSGCGLVKSANALHMTVAAGSSATTLLCNVTGAGVYDLGELVMESGVNTGVRRAVKRHTAGHLVLAFPLPDAPATGDTFVVYRGCDKAMGTCATKFNNLVHYKGMPFVPAPETAV